MNPYQKLPKSADCFDSILSNLKDQGHGGQIFMHKERF